MKRRPTPGARRHTPTSSPRSAVSRPDSGRHATHLVHVLGVRRPVPASGTTEERIAAVARRQRGLISRAQLRACGISNSAIGRLAARGYLIRVHREVYAVGHVAPAPLAAETAALLACGKAAVLSHHGAARLQEILRSQDDSIHVTVPRRHGASPPGIHVHRTSTLSPADIQIRHGLPLTAPARTLLDLAATLDRRNLEWAVDEALQQRIVTLRALLQMAQRHAGHRGSGRLRRAAERHRATGITRSQAEKRFRALIRAAELPDPLTNVKIHGVEVDFYWPDRRLVVEVDSYRFHRTRPKFEHDSVKGAKLVAAGLAVMRVTWYQMEDEPFAIVARVAQAMTRAA